MCCDESTSSVFCASVDDLVKAINTIKASRIGSEPNVITITTTDQPAGTEDVGGPSPQLRASAAAFSHGCRRSHRTGIVMGTATCQRLDRAKKKRAPRFCRYARRSWPQASDPTATRESGVDGISPPASRRRPPCRLTSPSCPPLRAPPSHRRPYALARRLDAQRRWPGWVGPSPWTTPEAIDGQQTWGISRHYRPWQDQDAARASCS